MASKELSREDGQGELDLTRRADANDVPIEIVRRQRSGAAAFCLALQSSGLEDKEVYGPLKIDPGYFSRIKKGEATLQVDLLGPFCDVVGNRIYAEWHAYQVGCTLVQIQSEAERRLAAERERTARLQDRLAYVEGLLQGRAAA